MRRETFTDYVAELREHGAEVVHLSWGAKGHEKAWYCSAAKQGPPPISAHAFGDTMPEAMAVLYEQVKYGWPREVAT